MNDHPDDEAPGRRQFLKCMAWAGTGTLWLMKGGVLQARALEDGRPASIQDASFSFVQISDSHIGFHKEPNMDVVGTLRASLALVDAQKQRPDFLIHTGDLTHLSRPEEFETLAGVMREGRARQVFYVPGEHDVIGDNGAEFSVASARNSSRAGGTASTIAACTSSGWSTCSISRPVGLASWVRTSWPG